MLAVTMIFGGVVWYVQKRSDELERAVNSTRGNPENPASGLLPKLAQAKSDVQAMLGVYEKNKEDEARLSGITWFTTIYERKGIADASIQLGAWKVPPADGPDGNCWEERYDMKVSNKQPLKREEIGKFLFEIERSSTRMRTIELSIQRNGKEDQQEEDAWTGSILVGYRRPKMKEEGK